MSVKPISPYGRRRNHERVSTSMLIHSLTRRHDGRMPRGQSMVEMAMVLPVLLLVVAGTIDLGRAYFSSVALENAAKEGALYGARKPLCDQEKPGCTAPNTVEWHVLQELTGVADTTVSVVCMDAAKTSKQLSDCADGDTYRVSVSAPFRLITPLISSLVGTETLTLSTASTAVVLTGFSALGATPVAIPHTEATPVPVGTCWVPDFLSAKVRKNDAETFWRDFSMFTTTPIQVGGPGNWLVKGQSLLPRTSVPCNSTITISDQPIAASTPTPTPTPTPSPSATPTPTPAGAVTPTPSPTPAPTPTPLAMCTVPQLAYQGVGQRITVTQAQGVWVNAGFAVGNFSAQRPPNDDYKVATQSVARNTVAPCQTTKITVTD